METALLNRTKNIRTAKNVNDEDAKKKITQKQIIMQSYEVTFTRDFCGAHRLSNFPITVPIIHTWALCF